MGKSKGSNSNVLDIFLPGMINAYGYRGRFPAISITGSACALACEHCRGYLLNTMYHVNRPEELLSLLNRLEKRGMIGALISGGCDKKGRMPWKRFLPFLSNFNTDLYLIAHGGMYVSQQIAESFKGSVIREVLIDVVGDPQTLEEIYHIKDFDIIEETLKNLYSCKINVAPHIIIGINRGKIKGEYRALDLLSSFQNEHVILVVFMPTVLKAEAPNIEDVLDVFYYARKLFKRVTLGCARPKGSYRKKLEMALIERNLIDGMALWSDEAIKKALEMGYGVKFYEGCCSIPLRKEIPVLKQSYGIGVSK